MKVICRQCKKAIGYTHIEEVTQKYNVRDTLNGMEIILETIDVQIIKFDVACHGVGKTYFIPKTDWDDFKLDVILVLGDGEPQFWPPKWARGK